MTLDRGKQAEIALRRRIEVQRSSLGAEETAEKLIKGLGKWAGQEESLKPTDVKESEDKRAVDMFKHARAVADITLGLVENTDELRADTAEVGHEKFSEATRRLWADFLTVHGKESSTWVKEGKERKREVVVKAQTDIDGRASLSLLRLAGIDTGKVRYVLPGDAEAGRINIDTSNNDGIGRAILPTGESYFFIDHHGSKSDSQTSASAHLFRSFTDLGLLPPKELRVLENDSAEAKAEKEKKMADLRKAVDFVTAADNLGFRGQGKLFSQSDRTLVGLRHMRQMTFEKMLEIISAGKNPLDVLEPKDLVKFGLVEAGEFQRKVIKDAQEYLDFLQADGRVLPSRSYGKVIVDIYGQLPAGADAASFVDGAGAYILWDDRQNSFLIYTLNQKKLAPGFKLEQGMRIREGMWIKPRREGMEKLKISLASVLRALGCDDKLNLKELFDVKNRWKKFQQEKKTRRAGEPPAGLPVAEAWSLPAPAAEKRELNTLADIQSALRNFIIQKFSLFKIEDGKDQTVAFIDFINQELVSNDELLGRLDEVDETKEFSEAESNEFIKNVFLELKEAPKE